MKHTSWLSGLDAVRSPRRAASRAHLVLRQRTDRQQHVGRAAPARARTARSSGPSTGRAPRPMRRPPSRSTTSRVVARGDRVEAEGTARCSSRSNLRWRLHSMHGLGVRPAAWSATYGPTTSRSKSSPKLKTGGRCRAAGPPVERRRRRTPSSSPCRSRRPRDSSSHRRRRDPAPPASAAATDESTPPDMATSTFTSVTGGRRERRRRSTAGGITSSARSTSSSVVA